MNALTKALLVAFALTIGAALPATDNSMPWCCATKQECCKSVQKCCHSGSARAEATLTPWCCATKQECCKSTPACCH